MSDLVLKVKTRSTGKHSTKQVRNSGLVPGIFYIKGEESIPIVSDPLSLRYIVYTSETKIVNLEVEGYPESKECILKNVDFHPVNDKILHFDLHGVTRGQLMNFEVPVNLVGTSVGVKLGGLLQQLIHKLPIRCLPKNLPSTIEIDISGLKMGHAICIKDIATEGIEYSLPPDTAVVSCVQSRISRAADEDGGDLAAVATDEAESTEE